MNKKFKYILLSSIFVFFAFIAAYNLSAKNEADKVSGFSTESPFDENAFEQKGFQGEELMGIPDPPDDNGTPITTPINDSIFEIFFLLITGVLVILFRKKIFVLRV